MQIGSSARRTCMASASAVEWTATVLMPISWQARWMRSAISPRLAMRTFWIIGRPGLVAAPLPSRGSLDDDERLVELDRLRILDEDLANRAGARCGDGVHHLHRLDDHQSLADADRLARRHERPRPRLGREINGADHRRLDGAGVRTGRDIGG